jgi:predicted glycoside hydrolase/deacetylase ChbG (UPF0249 family)
MLIFTGWRNLMRSLLITSLAPLALASPASFADERATELLIRTDDIGMSHSVNMALREFMRTGLRFSATIMVPCPWFQEAAEMLRDNPNVSVGIHLTLNSEWTHYRWGPVLGASAVPSLVDENGYFFPTGEQLRSNGMKLDEVEAELRAQIEQALRAGLDVEFLDYHMLTAVSTPGLRTVVEKLAKEYDLALSRYFGEPSLSLWDVEPDRKLSTLLQSMNELHAGKTNLLVIHLGLETDEMRAMIDANNPNDPYRVAQHRYAELQAVTSPAFLEAIRSQGLHVVTYGDLARRGEPMSAPAEFGYSMDEGVED